MPFVLLIIGLILITAGVRNTVSGSDGLFSLVQGDFTGQNNFIYWFLSIVVIGSIGYIPKLKGLSTAFLAIGNFGSVFENGKSEWYEWWILCSIHECYKRHSVCIV